MAEQTATRPLEGRIVPHDNRVSSSAKRPHSVPAFENWNYHSGKVTAVSSSRAPATLSARLCC